MVDGFSFCPAVLINGERALLSFIMALDVVRSIMQHIALFEHGSRCVSFDD
jgi:hypothetical protein